MVKEGKKRKLVINGVKLEDAGKITCKTNADEASADLGVKRECRRRALLFTTLCLNNAWIWMGS